jgi:hypothetical protein
MIFIGVRLHVVVIVPSARKYIAATSRAVVLATGEELF